MKPFEHEHTPEAIRERLAEGPQASYLRDWVYGGIDGSVTTFAVVSGVAGASLSPSIVLILGIANLVADGFSMAASNYMGTRTEKQEKEALRARELRHIRIDPDGEREEVRQIFATKGLDGDDLERVVDAVTSDKDRWIEFMLTEEYGLPQQLRSATKAALSTFSSFVICGFIPLIPFILGVPHAFLVATVMTLIVFFGIGTIRSKWLLLSWWRAGMETFAIGAIAAGLAYVAGVLVGRL